MAYQLILYTGLSGLTVFLGGLLARFFQHHVEDAPVRYVITHSLMSFGAGVILSAVSLVLVPEGAKELRVWQVSLLFPAGALFFLFLDEYLSTRTGKVATLMAMLMDFIPESIALGATFASDVATAILLSVFIGLQNLPEAFNSFRDLVISGYTEQKTLLIFFGISFFGIASALMGYLFLSDRHSLTASLMIFSSGGILYLLIQDIIPDSKYQHSYKTSLGATAGFLLGLIGFMIF